MKARLKDGTGFYVKHEKQWISTGDDPWLHVGPAGGGDIYVRCEITEPASMAGRDITVIIPSGLTGELLRQVRQAAIDVRSQPA